MSSSNAALSAASAIPFAGYAASAAKGVKYAAKGVDAAQSASKAADAAKGAGRAADAAQSAGKAAPSPAKAASGGSGPTPAKAAGGGGSAGPAKASGGSGGTGGGARAAGSASSGGTNVYHATTSTGATRGVLGGIDPKYLNPDSRFGRAFYVAEQADTAIAELAHHGATATHMIRFSFNRAGANVLDLTDSATASAWGYSGGPISAATKAIGSRARGAGFNAIKFPSLRGPGNNYAVLNDFNSLLSPQGVSPV